MFRAALGNSAFLPRYGRRGLDGSFRRCAEIVYCSVSLQGWRVDVQRAARIGELVRAAPNGISFAGWRVATSRWAASKSPTGKSMTANAVRFAAGLALAAFAAPLPATAQYFPPVMIIVPPAAQDYATPKAAPKPPPDKPKAPADSPPLARPAGHYQGQTFVPD
jgi:hypothetical protein